MVNIIPLEGSKGKEEWKEGKERGDVKEVLSRVLFFDDSR